MNTACTVEPLTTASAALIRSGADAIQAPPHRTLTGCDQLASGCGEGDPEPAEPVQVTAVVMAVTPASSSVSSTAHW